MYLDSFKQSLMMVRVVVDMIVKALYIVMQFFITLFQILVPRKGFLDQILKELEFWFNQLVILMVDALKSLADMFFNLIFSLGPVGSAFKAMLEGICWFIDKLIWAWNESCGYPCMHI